VSRRVLLLVLLAAALTAGAAWWQSSPSVTQARAAFEAQASAATAADVGVGALGRVEPESRIRKLSQPGGFSVNRVERLLVAEGDQVTEGQLLAELSDARQKDAAVFQAEAALAEARAALAKVHTAGRPSEIAAQQARIVALQATEDINRRDAARADQLASTGAGARAAAERNRAAAARAAAERAEAEAQL
jgi:HlyD family secretion protein